MAKMRIYDIARSMQEKLPDIKSKDVVKLLQENGFEAKSAQSVIEDDAIGFLLKHFNKVVAQKAAKKENTKNSKPVKQNKTSNQEHKPKAERRTEKIYELFMIKSPEGFDYCANLRYYICAGSIPCPCTTSFVCLVI